MTAPATAHLSSAHPGPASILGSIGRSLGRAASIARKEVLQLRRDRLTLAMMVVLPVMQLLLFGFAIDTDVRHIPTVVFDQDGSAASRDFANRMRATGFYDLVGNIDSLDEAAAALRQGRAKVALVVPPRWSADLTAGRTAPLQLVVDGSDPQTVASALNTAAGLAQARASDITLQRLERTGARIMPAPMSLEPVTWYNPDLRTAIYIVPGLVGVILTLTMVMITAMALVRERERGTLEQLIVSPLRSGELVAGKIAPFVAMGYFQMTLILTLGRLVFKVPFAGSLPLLYGLAFFFIAGNLALGLVFSTIAQTQQQAMQMSFFFIMPNILLSGFMFPYEAMPKPAQFLSQLLPLTHFLRIVRGIVLKGAGFADLRIELLWMAAVLSVLVCISAFRFKKKLG